MLSDEGVIKPHSIIECNRESESWFAMATHTADNLTQAITHSCNPYFREVMKRVVLQGKSNPLADAAIGLDKWSDRVKEFGFGTNLGGHLPGSKKRICA